MTKLIENLKASIFVSTLTKNLSMYSRFDALNLGVSMAVVYSIQSESDWWKSKF